MCLAIEYPVLDSKYGWHPNWPMINMAERWWDELSFGKLRIAIGFVALPKDYNGSD